MPDKRKLTIGRGKERLRRKHTPSTASLSLPGNGPSLTGKTVFYVHEGQRVAGTVVKEVSSERVSVELALPDDQGVLHRTGTCLILEKSGLDTARLAVSQKKIDVREWDATVNLDTKVLALREGNEETGRILDYRDVTISGYLSTFVETTARDRDGDYVLPGAFDKTLAGFRKNPVMLIDHRNSVEMLAGSFTKIGTTPQGLIVEGLISNAPGLVDIRFKVAEKHLKSLSMGGLLYYGEDGRGIEVVDLFEGSLTPIPANPDALFEARSLSLVVAAKMFKRFADCGKRLRISE